MQHPGVLDFTTVLQSTHQSHQMVIIRVSITAMAVVPHSPSAFLGAGVLLVQLKSRSRITGAYDSTLSRTGLTYHKGLGDSTHSE
jgi:hypothetical protein